MQGGAHVFNLGHGLMPIITPDAIQIAVDEVRAFERAWMRVAVIGGGISGLATGWYAARARHDVDVFEAGDAPGGTMTSLREGGFAFDAGPNGFLVTKLLHVAPLSRPRYGRQARPCILCCKAAIPIA